MVGALLEHWEDAYDNAPAPAGSSWYADARAECRRMARAHGSTLTRVAGVVAALSPQLQWGVNLRIAEQVLSTGTAQEGCLTASRQKAERIYDGERPADVLGGPKVRAFYRALLGDADAAVVDTWMFHAVGWPEKGGRGGKLYERVADALREAAALAQLPVSEFQAIVWTQVRGSEV
jgi:hypothetical protein